ncbi:hypothetical protein TNCV_1876271 [Trichonephila clavipes]|nr:hypothetical protein TNCV_1876271 [Trichonephila clavipes]
MEVLKFKTTHNQGENVNKVKLCKVKPNEHCSIPNNPIDGITLVSIGSSSCIQSVFGSATLVFGYHFDIAKKRILTQEEIDRYMNNSDELSELSEDGLDYSDDDVDFYLIVCHLMKIRIATVKIVLVQK